MKLTDIQGEQALEVFADIMEPAAEILTDDEVKAFFNSDQPLVKLIAYVLKHHKKAVLEILARLDGEDPETYSVNVLTLPKKMLELLNDPGVTDLFTSQETKNG